MPLSGGLNSYTAIQNIQSTWTYDCVWIYLVQDHMASQQVADTDAFSIVTKEVENI